MSESEEAEDYLVNTYKPLNSNFAEIEWIKLDGELPENANPISEGEIHTITVSVRNNGNNETDVDIEITPPCNANEKTDFIA